MPLSVTSLNGCHSSFVRDVKDPLVVRLALTCWEHIEPHLELAKGFESVFARSLGAGPAAGCRCRVLLPDVYGG